MITQEYLKECFDYNPLTGVLTWKERPIHHFKNEYGMNVFNAQHAMKSAGWIDKTKSGKSYYKTEINGRAYRNHRIIWFILNGNWPNKIDHKDGNGLNNKKDNIRNTDNFGNARNQRLHKTNNTGVSGVHWCNTREKWTATIRINDIQRHLGYFDVFNDAVIIRKMNEYELGFHKNHGTNRPL